MIHIYCILEDRYRNETMRVCVDRVRPPARGDYGSGLFFSPVFIAVLSRGSRYRTNHRAVRSLFLRGIYSIIISTEQNATALFSRAELIPSYYLFLTDIYSMITRRCGRGSSFAVRRKLVGKKLLVTDRMEGRSLIGRFSFFATAR